VPNGYLLFGIQPTGVTLRGTSQNQAGSFVLTPTGPTSTKIVQQEVAGSVRQASNAAPWKLDLVTKVATVAGNTVDVKVWWSDDGVCDIAEPAAANTFASADNLAIPVAAAGAGFALDIPAAPGTVARTFDANDRLCVSIHSDGPAELDFATGQAMSNAAPGGMTRLASTALVDSGAP
jgi:hypothetical protein